MSLRIHGKRTLKSPAGLDTRPTSSRIRQSLFGILQDRVPGSSWLDVCAGAGTIGAEALSRGAALVVGIESSRSACAIIRSNWQRVTSSDSTAEVFQADARVLLRRGFVGSLSGIGFDVIYFDPPYESPLYGDVLPLLPRYLAPDGYLFVEHSRKRSLPERIGLLGLQLKRDMGQGALSLYRHHALAAEDAPLAP